MGIIKKFSNVGISDIEKVSSVSSIAKIDDVSLGTPTILRLEIANDGDEWDPTFSMAISGTGVVDWGDGSPTETANPVLSPHTYATAGTYDATLTPTNGLKTRLNGVLGATTADTQVTEVIAFGDCGTVQFKDWQSLVTIPLDGYLDLTGVEVFNAFAFENCGSFVGPTSMSGYALLTAPSSLLVCFNDNVLFNRPGLNDLDVSSVVTMNAAFSGAQIFNQPLDSWNVSSVTDMRDMFNIAFAFNQDISGWNVGSVTNMSGMFAGAFAFNQPLNGWNVSGVTDMSRMFRFAIAFNQNLGAWTFKNNVILNEIFSSSGMSDANVALCLEGWDSVGQGTSVDATDMFGSTARTMSESTYPNAKTAYDNLISTYSWDFTGSFNWVA